MNKPLKILFDSNPIVNGQKSGIGYYTYMLIEALAKNYPDEIELVGHYFNFFGTKGKVELPQAPNISYIQSKIIPGKILSVTRFFGFQLPLELFFKRRGDFALFTNYVSLPSITKVPRAIVIHDLAYLETPSYVSKRNRNFLKRFVKKSIDTASLIISVSQFTKKTILKHYEIDESKILVTTIPPAPRVNSKSVNLESLNINKKFILFIGTLEPRKNILNLVKSYELLPKTVRDKYTLVLAGGVGWYMEETLDYIASSKANGNDILLMGYVNDSVRSALYKNASLFVFPSFYEGFGMPILEAMSYGVPTAISDIEVFHEIAGDAALYFDQERPESISLATKEVLDDTNLHKKLVSSGYEKLLDYKWDDVAKKVYDTMSNICD